jgi:CYTH domain-containing protein
LEVVVEHPAKYAQIERERRFLVRELPDGIHRVDEVHDAYLIGTRMRLRQTTNGDDVILKLGQKVRLGRGPREIASTSIYLVQVEWDLLYTLPAHHLHKRRHHVRRDGYIFAIDEFPDGSLVAEFDDGEAEPSAIPAWLDVMAEVTDDEAWTGAGRATASGS